LFTSADTSGTTDIFRWDPKSNSVTRVTRTPESEYSPTPFGDWSGATGFCAVRVEADSTQRLWRFDLDGSNPRLVVSEVDSVGYFAWIDDGIAVFRQRKATRVIICDAKRTWWRDIVCHHRARTSLTVKGWYRFLFGKPDGRWP
jgi:hypothetical protein